MGLPGDIPLVGLRPGKKGFRQSHPTHTLVLCVLRTTVHTIFSKPPDTVACWHALGLPKGGFQPAGRCQATVVVCVPSPDHPVGLRGGKNMCKGGLLHILTITAQERRQLCKHRAERESPGVPPPSERLSWPPIPTPM